MISIEQLLDMWKKDHPLDKTNLVDASCMIPELHYKYYRILAGERLILRRMELHFKVFERDAYEYYKPKGSNVTQEMMDKWGWEHKCPFAPALKEETTRYVQADPMYIKLMMEIAEQKEKIEGLEEILDSISKRTFMIKHALDAAKREYNEIVD